MRVLVFMIYDCFGDGCGGFDNDGNDHFDIHKLHLLCWFLCISVFIIYYSFNDGGCYIQDCNCDGDSQFRIHTFHLLTYHRIVVGFTSGLLTGVRRG